MKTPLPTIYILIPAYNEAKVIASVIKEVREKGYNNIIVVDDGSTDATYRRAKENNCIALRHTLNRGKGAATKTAIEAAKILGADIAVTMDADGQHDPEDIKKLIAPIQNRQYDVTLGTRLTDAEGMPLHKIIANYIANFFTWVIHGLWVTDSQSGFRAYSKHALEVIDTVSSQYEFGSEVIREIRRHKLRYIELPISVLYTEYSTSKQHKQSFTNGLKTLYGMIWHRLL